MSNPSVQLYSVRDAIDEDLDRAVARVAEIGFRRVEPYAFHLRTADYKRAFAASGVTAPDDVGRGARPLAAGGRLGRDARLGRGRSCRDCYGGRRPRCGWAGGLGWAAACLTSAADYTAWNNWQAHCS